MLRTNGGFKVVTAKFKRWMASASSTRKKEVASGARISLSLLYQLGYGYRNASSELAARVETATEGELTRADMNETCNGCKYFKECQK